MLTKAYKLAETFSFKKYTGSYESYQDLFIDFGLNQSLDPWVDAVSQLQITQVGISVNVDGYVIKYVDGYWTSVDFDSSFMVGYTTDLTDVDPQWKIDKTSYSTKTVADTLYKPYAYTPSWIDITSKPSFATVATSGSYNDLSNKPSIPTVTGASGTYGAVTVSNGLVSSGKRMETYSGTTNGSGLYNVTFSTAYSVAPNIQAQLIGGNDLTFFRIVSVSTTGFSVYAFTRSSITTLPILGTLTSALLGSAATALSGANIDVLITEK